MPAWRSGKDIVWHAGAGRRDGGRRKRWCAAQATAAARPCGAWFLASCLTLASAAHARSPSAPADGPAVAVLPIKLLDTSAEPRDQRAEHARRLEAMARQLVEDLAGTGSGRAVFVPADQLHARCPDEAPQCLLESAREVGADFVFVGVVHKSSTLIMQIFARLTDARTGRDVFSRDLNFRGDNDESWRRAERFLVDQIATAAPFR